MRISLSGYLEGRSNTFEMKEKSVMTTNVKIYPGKWPVIAGLWLFAVGVVLFWISFFWGGAVHASDDACYAVFERNFVVADLFTALAGLILASVWRPLQRGTGSRRRS